MPVWDVASVAAKLASLLGLAGVVGGAFCLYLLSASGGNEQRTIVRYILLCSVVGLIASGLFFLIQVGAVADTGMAGMIDPQLSSILAQSGLGYAIAMRLLACVLGVALVGLHWRGRGKGLASRARGVVSLLLFASISLLLGLSFSRMGHVAALDVLAQAAIMLHVLGAFLWVGSLYPLWSICGSESSHTVRAVMQCFGDLAMYFVGALLFSGAYLLTQLVGSLQEILSTAYGISLLIKLLAVSGLLALACLNRFVLVPRLGSPSGIIKLKRSIQWEMGVACVILAVTAYLSTVVELMH